MLHESIVLSEAPLIQQHLNPLASGQLATGVLLLDALLTCSESEVDNSELRRPFDRMRDEEHVLGTSRCMRFFTEYFKLVDEGLQKRSACTWVCQSEPHELVCIGRRSHSQRLQNCASPGPLGRGGAIEALLG